MSRHDAIRAFTKAFAERSAMRLAEGVTVRLRNDCNDYEVCAAVPHARAVRVPYEPDYPDQCRALALAVDQVLGLVPMLPDPPVWYVFEINRRERTVTLSREFAGYRDRTVSWDAARLTDGRSFDQWEPADATPVELLPGKV